MKNYNVITVNVDGLYDDMPFRVYFHHSTYKKRNASVNANLMYLHRLCGPAVLALNEKGESFFAFFKIIHYWIDDMPIGSTETYNKDPLVCEFKRYSNWYKIDEKL